MRTTPGLFQVLGGDLRPRPQLRVGIVWGVAPGDAGGANLQGPVSGHPIEIPRPPLTGCLRIGWLQAGIPEPHAPRSPCNVPAAGRQGSGTAPVTHACPQATGNVRPRAVGTSRVTADLFRGPPSGFAAARSMPEQVRHDHFYPRPLSVISR